MSYETLNDVTLKKHDHAKESKPDEKSQEPYDFNHMWYIKLKAQMNN